MMNIPDAIDFVCPFCGASCSTSLEQGAVLHRVPMCARFARLGPVEFLRAVNDHIAQRRVMRVVNARQVRKRTGHHGND